MTDFGRKAGDMAKAVYDTDDDGLVDDSDKLEGSSKAQVQDHVPKSHTHTEAQITDLDHDATKIQGKTVDDTDIGDGKAITYQASGDKLVYIDPPAGGGLPKTGQTTSYRDGDDGYYEAGWEGDRFTDNADGTITDNATGLMWPQDFTGDGGNNGASVNWEDAIDWANALSFAGHGDWKIPNLFEFVSVHDCGLSQPAFPAIFTVEGDTTYWTSTTQPNATTDAHYVFTKNMRVARVIKIAPFRVVCCRAV